MDADFIHRLNAADRLASIWQVPTIVFEEEIRALGFKIGEPNGTLECGFYYRMSDLDADRRDRR